MEWAITLYPDDANLFDSMGELQTEAGNIEKAKYYYTQSLSIIEDQKKELPESAYKSTVKWLMKNLIN